MSGRLMAVIVSAGLLSLSADARADAADAEGVDEVPPAEQQLVARLGIAMGGRVTPGGLRVSGSYLYQLSDVDWADGWLAFTFGGGDAGCFRDRDDVLLCDHGILSGVAAELGGGVRRTFPQGDAFTPYARAGLGLRLVSYGDDELRGLGLPVVAAGGVSARVHRYVAVGGEVALEAGPGFFGRELGLEPQLGLVVAASVEFGLE